MNAHGLFRMCWLPFLAWGVLYMLSFCKRYKVATSSSCGGGRRDQQAWFRSNTEEDHIQRQGNGLQGSAAEMEWTVHVHLLSRRISITDKPVHDVVIGWFTPVHTCGGARYICTTHEPSSEELFHGTHYKALSPILTAGFRESCVPGREGLSRTAHIA